MDVHMFQGLGMYESEDAANARSGNGEQNPAQVHISNEAKRAQSSTTNTIQDFRARFVGQQWCQVYFLNGCRERKIYLTPSPKSAAN